MKSFFALSQAIKIYKIEEDEKNKYSLVFQKTIF